MLEVKASRLKTHGNKLTSEHVTDQILWQRLYNQDSCLVFSNSQEGLLVALHRDASQKTRKKVGWYARMEYINFGGKIWFYVSEEASIPLTKLTFENSA